MESSTLSPKTRKLAIAAVAFSAAMWAFWWYPVRIIEVYGTSGAWTGTIMSIAALALSLPLLIIFPGKSSSRAFLGAFLIGGAVILYTVAVSYTDFIRAVIIFYIAPAWSLIIECTFLGRRWTLRALASIAASLIGLMLISRGEFSLSGAGAIGDWMALFAGLSWSIGSALLFSASRSNFSWTVISALAGSIFIGQGMLLVWGSALGSAPDMSLIDRDALLTFGLAGLYLSFILGCTIWGASLLAPTIMSFLLSIEILAGVIVSAAFLGERFGLFEVFGAAFVMGAVVLELTRKAESMDS